MSAPAATKRSTYRSGSWIMRWTSNGRSVTRRSEATTGGPIVRLGTKWPSMTSRWRSRAPPSRTASISSPRRAKSADSSEGASAGPRGMAAAPRGRPPDPAFADSLIVPSLHAVSDHQRDQITRLHRVARLRTLPENRPRRGDRRRLAARRGGAQARACQDRLRLLLRSSDAVGHHEDRRAAAAGDEQAPPAVARSRLRRQRVLPQHEVLGRLAAVDEDLAADLVALLSEIDLRHARRPAAQLGDRGAFLPEAHDDLHLAIDLDAGAGSRLLGDDVARLDPRVMPLGDGFRLEALASQQTPGLVGGEADDVGHRDAAARARAPHGEVGADRRHDGHRRADDEDLQTQDQGPADDVEGPLSHRMPAGRRDGTRPSPGARMLAQRQDRGEKAVHVVAIRPCS